MNKEDYNCLIGLVDFHGKINIQILFENEEYKLYIKTFLTKHKNKSNHNTKNK